MIRVSVSIASVAALLALATPSAAWEGELAGAVRPISEVIAKAQSNDFVVVEGRVTDVRSGDGSLVIVILEDDTGSVPLAVPNHLLRHFAGGGPTGGAGPTGADPQVGRRARVGGKWDHKAMDNDTWGIRVQRAERVED